MNAVVGTYRDEMDVEYAVDFGRDREPTTKRGRFPDYRRHGGPARVGGMHCRRNKRWTWGSGRGARMLNMRAFASCVAWIVASTAASAFGVTIDYATINNIGNAGNPSSNPAGLGAVSNVFNLAKTETSNQQYVEFLNAVDRAGTNPNSIYSASMGSSTNGGITFNSGAAVGSKYSVKAGAPAGAPAGTSYAQMPVNFVTWFSAARFVNWIANGQLSGTAGTSSMEVGSYTLANRTSGTIAPRNANATVFLPSANEWYKAGFYNGTSGTYTTFQTNNNATPTATVTNFALANAANYNSVATGPINVAAYGNTTSAYGLYGMLGNVMEMTDTSNASGQYRAMGGGYGATATQVNATATAIFQNSTFTTDSYGFRVAAVPEPTTIALAGIGILSLGGLEWMKRRKRRLAATLHRLAA